jgi:tartrate-resistant acid phosphatase type 5
MQKIFLLFSIFVVLRGNTQVFTKDSALTKKSSYTLLQSGALNFISIGDWGRCGADHQKQVAIQLGKSANDIASQFTIATGDNFYPSGVASEWDPLWKYSFEDIYTDFRLQWDWYPVLGNHDYKSNPEAQVKYSGISRRWRMPARYYSRLFSIPSDTASKVLILFIDTNPLIPAFYTNSEYGPNVKTQDSLKQKKWIEKELSNKSPAIKWKIVVGHHPMYTGGSRTESYDTRAIRFSLEPLLKKYKVNVYLAGHEHSLQHISTDGQLHHFISGTASEKTTAVLIPGSQLAAAEYGFLAFSILSTEMVVQAIDYTGKIIYQTSIKK